MGKFNIARVAKDHGFGLAVLGCAAVAFAFPRAFISWGGVKLVSLVVPAIQLIMFGMGTTLSANDFLSVAKSPWAVVLGVALQFIVMPLIGLSLVGIFGFTGELAAGFILVGAVAGGTASNVVAYLAGANVALSVTMTCCSTLISPFATPLLMKLLAGRFMDISAKKMMIDCMKIVLVPVLAGGVVRYAFCRTFEEKKALCGRVLSFVSMAGICFTILVLTADGHATLRDVGLLIVAAAVLHNILGYAGGYWAARLLGRVLRLDERDARTVAIEVGMQNSGMAAALSKSALGSTTAALPATVFSIWMDFSGSVLANYWRKKKAN
ncbi:MAG: bile acid:sodium symporter family protein [Kiritimatiellae bacterium]|nr:bile acid:sodium symporter family protein [Kiritimatiellia bacterium]